MKQKNLFVITGGPGVGKTTLINQLEKQGFLTVPEEARKIIRQQVQTGGDSLPWKNKMLYAKLMLNASMETYNIVMSQSSHNIIFFDRGIIDSICYMKMENLPITTELKNNLTKYRYNPKVFVLPPWQEIYKTDSERKQTWEEAIYTFEQMKQTYLEYGYDIIEVPEMSVDERCHFVLQHIHGV